MAHERHINVGDAHASHHDRLPGNRGWEVEEGGLCLGVVVDIEKHVALGPA